LLFDKFIESDRVIGFATKKHLKLLDKAKFWEIDGTFDIVPNIFYQLVTIHCPLSDASDSPVLPCVYIN
jgi:hypothetical protein